MWKILFYKKAKWAIRHILELTFFQIQEANLNYLSFFVFHSRDKFAYIKNKSAKSYF